jgi:hypothetical protein
MSGFKALRDAIRAGRISVYRMPSMLGGGFGMSDAEFGTMTDGNSVAGCWATIQRVASEEPYHNPFSYATLTRATP